MKNKVIKFFKKNYKLMLATFLIGILANGFALTNKLLIYDEINHVFAKGVSFQSGRWGLELASFIFPNVSMPWYNGFFALVILSITFCLVVDIFEIKNKYFRVIICFVLMTFPAMSSTFAFMYAVTAYSISIFLSIISVLLLRSKKTISNILAIITIIFSLSIYQAYVCITMIMLIILLMKDCIDKNKSSRDIIYSGLKYVIIIALSLILYLDITKIINCILNIPLGDYKGIDSMGKFTIKEFISGIITSYCNIFGLFDIWSLGDTLGFDKFMKVPLLISFLITAYLVIAEMSSLVKKNEKEKAILLLVLSIIQPLAVNFIVLINPKIGYLYSIMIYQYVFLVIESIILYEYFNEKTKNLKNIIYGLFILIIFQYVTLVNEFHFRLYLAYENYYSYTSGLVNRIVQTEGYDKDVPVLFVGFHDGELNTEYYEYFKKANLMGGAFENSKVIYPDMVYKFIKYYIGVDFNYIYYGDEKTVSRIKENYEFEKMNNYPYSNSIKKINGIIVVKFSD